MLEVNQRAIPDRGQRMASGSVTGYWDPAGPGSARSVSGMEDFARNRRSIPALR
jgi:hypothetical protein